MGEPISKPGYEKYTGLLQPKECYSRNGIQDHRLHTKEYAAAALFRQMIHGDSHKDLQNGGEAHDVIGWDNGPLVVLEQRKPRFRTLAQDVGEVE